MLQSARTSFFRSLLFRQEKELKFFVLCKAERRDWPVSRDTFLPFESVGTGGNLSHHAPGNRSCTSLCTVASVMFIRIVNDWVWFVICLQCCFFVHALNRCNVSVGCKNAFRISVNFITVNWCIFCLAGLMKSWLVTVKLGKLIKPLDGCCSAQRKHSGTLVACS